MSNAERIYGIAVNHTQTVQVCIDRLHELGRKHATQTIDRKVPKVSRPGDTTACCACAASGHAAAPPMSVMNSRRFTQSPCQHEARGRPGLRGRSLVRS